MKQDIQESIKAIFLTMGIMAGLFLIFLGVMAFYSPEVLEWIL